jgi:hypothetical protein
VSVGVVLMRWGSSKSDDPIQFVYWMVLLLRIVDADDDELSLRSLRKG